MLRPNGFYSSSAVPCVGFILNWLNSSQTPDEQYSLVLHVFRSLIALAAFWLFSVLLKSPGQNQLFLLFLGHSILLFLRHWYWFVSLWFSPYNIRQRLLHMVHTCWWRYSRSWMFNRIVGMSLISSNIRIELWLELQCVCLAIWAPFLNVW